MFYSPKCPAKHAGLSGYLVLRYGIPSRVPSKQRIVKPEGGRDYSVESSVLVILNINNNNEIHSFRHLDSHFLNVSRMTTLMYLFIIGQCIITVNRKADVRTQYYW